MAEGLLPGGGPGGRLANHFVVGPVPTQWSEARGFRRGSNAVVQCDLEVLRKSGVRLFQGADGVLLADVVPFEAIFRVLAADNQRGHYTEVLAEIGTDRRLHLVRDLRATAAAMGASAAATGSADAPTSVQLGSAPGERFRSRTGRVWQLAVGAGRLRVSVLDRSAPHCGRARR